MVCSLTGATSRLVQRVLRYSNTATVPQCGNKLRANPRRVTTRKEGASHQRVTHLCAMVSCVHSPNTLWMAFWMSASVSGSMLAVASSSMRMREWRSMARARQNSCFWPCAETKTKGGGQDVSNITQHDSRSAMVTWLHCANILIHVVRARRAVSSRRVVATAD